MGQLSSVDEHVITVVHNFTISVLLLADFVAVCLG